MREILFRGFCEKERGEESILLNGVVLKGQWETGHLIRYQRNASDESTVETGIIPDYASALYMLDVIPETIGQFTGLCDKNGKKIFEGDLILGKRRHMSGDGYLKKGYPSEISVVLEVVFKRGNFSTNEIGAIKEHEVAYSEYQYREGETSLSPSWKGAMYYNAETKKFDLEGDDKTCKHIEVIGTIFDVPAEEKTDD